MAQKDIPTFNEALSKDKAQFDDCTPCRLVGRSRLPFRASSDKRRD